MYHALGAIDGKHVSIKCPYNVNYLYYNCKGLYSIILLALVDADYKILWVDVGQNGSSSDQSLTYMLALWPMATNICKWVSNFCIALANLVQ